MSALETTLALYELVPVETLRELHAELRWYDLLQPRERQRLSLRLPERWRSGPMHSEPMRVAWDVLSRAWIQGALEMGECAHRRGLEPTYELSAGTCALALLESGSRLSVVGVQGGWRLLYASGRRDRRVLHASSRDPIELAPGQSFVWGRLRTTRVSRLWSSASIVDVEPLALSWTALPEMLSPQELDRWMYALHLASGRAHEAMLVECELLALGEV